MASKFSNRIGVIALSVALFLISAGGVSYAERPSHDGKVLLFGNLHAHSKLSDDIHGAGNEMNEESGFEGVFVFVGNEAADGANHVGIGPSGTLDERQHQRH